LEFTPGYFLPVQKQGPKLPVRRPADVNDRVAQFGM
jgi:hypothetical protein